MEIEEIRLCTLRHLLEETHDIALSSHKTEEEDGTADNNSDKEKEDKDNNDPNTTPSTPHNGWITNQSQWTLTDLMPQTTGGAEEEEMQPGEM